MASVQRLDPVPPEVLAACENAKPSRIFALPRSSTAKAGAWAACRKYGKTIGVREEHNYTGWRARHTRNYWAWVAVEMNALLSLADLGQQQLPFAEPESTSVDDDIEQAWKELQLDRLLHSRTRE
jgi:hypothetical protein